MVFAVIAGVALLIIVVINILPMCFMHPLSSGKIEGTNIIAVKNRINNLFFIPSGEDWIVIDAGSDARAVKREMELMAIDGQRVKSVFLTHTDYDHVASVVLFPNAAIYMSGQEKQMIDGSVYRQFFKKNSLPALGDSNKMIYLSDNAVVDFGEHKVRIIWASGHTKGSAMYAVDEKYLFTGDAFIARDGHIAVHPYTMDRKQAQETIYGIKDELHKYEKVFTAHYGVISVYGD
ncbi:MAG: MBL fold metallo-hydrolase [Lachnospiraceae bacterium]|nr:MBL fold metallo-hydrolase [Lachnospiraceae bacterium]